MIDEFHIPRHMRGRMAEISGCQGEPKPKCLYCMGSGKDFNDLRAPLAAVCPECGGTGIYEGP